VQLAWTRKVLAAVAATAFVGVLAVPGTAKDPLPAGGAAKQEDADLAFLKASIDKGVAATEAKKTKAMIDPVRTTAMLVALNAQNRMGGKDDEQLAGLRDQMLKLSAALADDEKFDWKAAAKALEGAKTAKGDKKPVDLAKDYDLAVTMNVFKKSARGGRGWEEDLSDMAQGKKPADADRVLEIAQGTHLVGQLAASLPPDGIGAKKKQWDGFSADMQKLSKDAADEAVKGKKADAAVLKKKLEAMDANCAACHKVFKTK